MVIIVTDFEVDEIKRKIAFFRKFNRDFTNQIGLFDTTFSGKLLSAAETRLLWEIGQFQPCAPKTLTEAIAVDPAYVSRTLKKFESSKLIARSRCEHDQRAYSIKLSSKGEQLLEQVIKKTEQHLDELLGRISPDDQALLFGAMKTILRLFQNEKSSPPFVIRTRQLGDVGRVLHLHGMVYGLENRFGEELESHVAKDLAELNNPKRSERSELWVAEIDNEIVGSVGLLDRGGNLAQLHWLIVKQNRRGLGIGKALVNTVVRFASQAGFKKIRLETGADQKSARKIYSENGFKRTASDKKAIFGQVVKVEAWELNLSEID